MDRRQRKTQEALIGAMGRCLARSDLDALTVQGISDEADVARSSFYEHFDNKRELLVAVLNALERECTTGSSEYAGMFDFLPGLLSHIETRKSRGRGSRLLGPSMLMEFRAFVGRLVEQRLLLLRPKPSPVRRAFITGGVLSSVEAWLARGCRESVAALTAEIELTAKAIAG